jgi:hypothetical protein
MQVHKFGFELSNKAEEKPVAETQEMLVSGSQSCLSRQIPNLVRNNVRN